MAKNKPLDVAADMAAGTPAGAPESAPEGGDTAPGVAQAPPPEALPQGGGRYTRTPAGDLVRVADQPTQPASNGNVTKEQA